MKPLNLSTNSRISAYATLLVVAFLSLFSSAPAVAACPVPVPSPTFDPPPLSFTFLDPQPSFVAYTSEAKTIRVQPCGTWWTITHSVSFSSNEPALALFDDGRHGDGADNDGVYGNIWKPTTTGPVTLSITATNPYSGASATGSVPGEVRPRFYSVEKVPFQWVDATTGVRQPLQQSWPPTPIPAIPIGFDFSYYGVPYNNLSISTEGALVMGRDWAGPYAYDSSGLYVTSLSPAEPNNVIAPFWDVSLDRYSGAMYTLLEGSTPNRRFTVSWVDVTYPWNLCPSDACDPAGFGTGSFQATLYEGSNDIVFRYLDVNFTSADGNPASPTVGVENSDGSQATSYYTYDQFSNAPWGITDLSALRFSATPLVVLATPTLTSFSPTSGPATGLNGTFVIVTGTNFDPAPGKTTVSLNGVDAPTRHISSPETLIFMVPRTATTGKITVTTPAGSVTSTTDFTVTSPTITSISPAFGKPGAVTFVKVDGSNFVAGVGQTKVTLNGMAAPNVQYVSPEILIFMTPKGATTGKVTVTTPNGSATSPGNFTFTNDCTLLNSITRVVSLGAGTGPVNEEIKVTFTGYITNAASFTPNPTTSVVNVCPGQVVTYAATATKGTLICKINKALVPNSGLVKADSKLTCSNLGSGGGDTDVFTVK